MKQKLLMFIVAVMPLVGCESMSLKSAERYDQSRYVKDVAKAGHNGLTRIQRGTSEYGFVLELDAGDSNIEVVMLDETSDEYLARLGEVAAVNLDDYVKKDQLDNAVNYLLKAQALAYSNDLIASLELIERALLIAPKSTQALAMRGSVMLQLGRTAEAKKSWSTALSYDSTMTDIKAHLEALK